MSRRWHWLRTALAALVATALLSGVGVARGDLFDDDFTDCPSSLRFEEEKDLVTDLTVSRSTETQGEITVSWKTSDPASWGLGDTDFYDAPHTAEARADAARLAGWWEANAFNVSHVVILDDKVNPPVEKRTPLGITSVTFENVATHTEAEVQMALVVASASGDVVVSDILQTDLLENLGEQGLVLDKPSFSSPWQYQAADGAGQVIPAAQLTGGDLANYQNIPKGAFYYIGYNHGFVNYAIEGVWSQPGQDPPITSYPSPPAPRVRIGLKHGGMTDADTLDTVGFKSYVIRIVDEDGDQVHAESATVLPGNAPSGYVTNLGHYVFVLDPDLARKSNTVHNVKVVDGSTTFPAVNVSGNLLRDGVKSSTSFLQAGGNARQTVSGVVFTDVSGLHATFPPSSDGTTTSQASLCAQVDINAVDTDGRTALHLAAVADDLAMVACLLNRGANINAVDTRDGSHPLHLAAQYSRSAAVVRLLLDRGAALEARDNAQHTPLQAASWSGPDAVANAALLLNRGADIQAVQQQSVTSLWQSIRHNRVAVTALLLDRGGYLSTPNEPLSDLITLANTHGSTAVAAMLPVRRNPTATPPFPPTTYYPGKIWYAPPPDAIGDFPLTVLDSGTYTLEAWAVGKNSQALSPKTSLRIRTNTSTCPALASGAAQQHALRDQFNFVTKWFSNEFQVTDFTVIK